MTPAFVLHLSGEEATRAFAGRLAEALNAVRASGASDTSGTSSPPAMANATNVVAPGLVIFLSGPLGAGKTTLVRGLLRALGHGGRVRSPSFTIMEPYALPGILVHHFDFYRFTASEEWREAGFEELIGAPGTLSLIEWPEMAGQSLAAPDLTLQLGLPEPDAVSPSATGTSAPPIPSVATEAQAAEDESFDGPRTLYLQAYSASGQELLAQLGTGF